MNAGGYQNAAHINAAALQRDGFTIDDITNADTDIIDEVGGPDGSTLTTIQFPPNLAASAAVLRAAVPQALMRSGQKASGITLIIGSNDIFVNGVTLPMITAASNQ
jgi:hypothetical protein